MPVRTASAVCGQRRSFAYSNVFISSLRVGRAEQRQVVCQPMADGADGLKNLNQFILTFVFSGHIDHLPVRDGGAFRPTIPYRTGEKGNP